MKIKLKSGIDGLVFGMKEKDVKALYGEPSRQFKDDENNNIYLYDDKKLRLTFYVEEDFKLGYIVASAKDLELFSEKVIGQTWAAIQPKLIAGGIKDFETETFDITDNNFNEANWVIFQVEYNEVVRVELGAAINNKDEFDWKF
ncbi:MAG: hypothetical protein V4581_11810 [Bacteroidota bacterium]